MKLVVVGGQGRKVGKTSVIAGLIRGLNTLAWTAVKISHHGGDADWPDTPCADARGPTGATRRVAPTTDPGHHNLPAHLDFLCSEERDPKALRDTSRFLAAGARRALWLRAREGMLAHALPGLLQALADDEYGIIESNSVVGILQPAVFLLVIGESGREVKASARQFLGCADAFVSVRPASEPGAKPGTLPQMLEGKAVFPVSAGEWSNAALCQFVRERLEPLEESV